MTKLKQWDSAKFGPFELHSLMVSRRPLFQPLLRVNYPNRLIPKFFLHLFFWKYLLYFEFNFRVFLKR